MIILPDFHHSFSYFIKSLYFVSNIFSIISQQKSNTFCQSTCSSSGEAPSSALGQGSNTTLTLLALTWILGVPSANSNRYESNLMLLHAYTPSGKPHMTICMRLIF